MNSAYHAFLSRPECESCSFIKTAFSLLGLPLKTISEDQIHTVINDTESRIILVCGDLASVKRINDTLDEYEHSLKAIFIHPANDLALHNRLTLQIPFTLNELNLVLSKATLNSNIPLELKSNPIFNNLIGESEQISNIRQMIYQVAGTDSTVLILGESGTGKDVIASCIHKLSKRGKHPYIPINCGAIPSELIESELFGHEKGAFTGANNKRAGRFELASDGTLFLDEIGDMPLNMQVKLLRVLQDRRITRIGGNSDIHVNVRIIAATNKNLEHLIKINKFREDLFYRLNVFPIHIPSLHDRPSDIPLLINYHLDKIQKRIGETISFTDDVISKLCQYAWPGNIRELENFIERMVILFRGHVVGIDNIDDKYKNTNKIQALHVIDKPFDIKDYVASI